MKYVGVFCLVIGTDRKCLNLTRHLKKLGYVGYVYAITKMNL
jgi:hypothetical protein